MFYDVFEFFWGMGRGKDKLGEIFGSESFEGLLFFYRKFFVRIKGKVWL